MNPSRDIPDEFVGVAQELESHRPQLSGLDADRTKLRAMAGAKTATRTSTKGTFMGSRLAITSLLGFGLLMTGSGAALGVSALTTTTSASQAQYGGKSTVDNPQVLGQPAEGDDVADDEDGEVLGDVVEGEAPVATAATTWQAQPPATAPTRPWRRPRPRQLESCEGDELPFTGYAAIPTPLIGIGQEPVALSVHGAVHLSSSSSLLVAGVDLEFFRHVARRASCSFQPNCPLVPPSSRRSPRPPRSAGRPELAARETRACT